MLTEICAEIRNYFSLEEDKIFGEFAVINGQITPPVDLQEGQFYRIVGSVFNDGVHQQGEGLQDETMFEGAVWKMRVPKDVLELDSEITAWQEKNADVLNSPFTSESFGGYSYTKASTSSNGSNGTVSWQSAFASKLNRYRRVRI